MKALVLVVAMAVATCTSCSGSTKTPEEPQSNGPIVAGADRGEVCLPVAAEGGEATFGYDVVTNTGDDPVTLTDVSAVDPRGLKIAEAVIVPVNGSLFGVWSTWPPRSLSNSAMSKEWAGRKPVAGYQVLPGTKPAYNLVVHLVKDAGGEAKLHALRIDYAVGGRSYRAETTTGLTLKPHCQ